MGLEYLAIRLRRALYLIVATTASVGVLSGTHRSMDRYQVRFAGQRSSPEQMRMAIETAVIIKMTAVIKLIVDSKTEAQWVLLPSDECSDTVAV